MTRHEANGVWVEILDSGNFVSGFTDEDREDQPQLSHMRDDFGVGWQIVYDPKTNAGVALSVDDSDPEDVKLSGLWAPVDQSG